LGWFLPIHSFKERLKEMKTLKKAFFAFFAVAIAFTAQANNNGTDVEPLVVKFRQNTEAMTFDVLINQVEANTELRLVDNAQNILWEDDAANTTGSYGKRINVKNLVNGEYNLIISTTEKELVQPLVVTDNGVEVQNKKRFTVYRPQINVKSNALVLKMRQNRNTVAQIQFADATGNVFFTDISNAASIRKNYDTSELEAGTYLFMVKTPYTSYQQEFQVK